MILLANLSSALQVDLELAQFLWPSLLVAAAVTLSSAPAGAIVLLRRDSLFALALPQVVSLGLALGLRFAMSPWLFALAAVTLALLLVAWSRHRQRGDILLPALYVLGLAGSILLICHSGQHLAELQNRFTGMDVAVDPLEAKIASPILALLALPVFLLWRRWLLIAQAPSTAQIAGLHPARWHLLFLSLLSIIILLATNLLGSLLVTAMLFIPALAALPWSPRLPRLMALSSVAGLASLVMGFELSAHMDWPLSHSIAAAAALLSALSWTLYALRLLARRFHSSATPAGDIP